MSIRPTYTSLYQKLGEIIALWASCIFGYYTILPLFGLQLSYNSSPIAIAVYFLLWSALATVYFWDVFARWLRIDRRIWVYSATSLLFAGLIWILLYLFTFLPAVNGLLAAPYTDILFATPWYFLPKAAEILLQQLLIAVLVLELSFRLRSLKQVVLGYAVCFGLIHVFLFLFTGAPVLYATIMTSAALLSASVFPYLILRVRGGFVYAYVIQLVFYILLAMFLHAWPPPGYGV
ncbi:MAG: hypothetical protein NT019_02780 [Candidatus Adlerbacteria bacterium]|nr:hypothetical protein [Candidatus Adlerbacteria bacterium]